MNNTNHDIKQLQSLTWQQLLKLGKSTVIAILDELSVWYDESDRYLCVCSLLYQYLKQQRIEQLADITPAPYSTDTTEPENDVLVDVEFKNLSFRELQLRSINKLHRKEVPFTPIEKPKPAIARVIRTHDNHGSYYGMPVLRCLVRDIKTGEEWWTGSNKLANIQPGMLVQECTDIQGYPVDWVVPYKQPITTN